jgi:hypothetical protein
MALGSNDRLQKLFMGYMRSPFMALRKVILVSSMDKNQNGHLMFYIDLSYWISPNGY